MGCAHKTIEAALDRLQESHWHLHQIEKHYHDADALRFSMNAFIRSLKEIPSMIAMALQNHKGFTAWHKPIKDTLKEQGGLFYKISQHRNYIVHKSSLLPRNKAFIASVRGHTIKMQFDFYIDPFEDSDVAITRFIKKTTNSSFILQALAPDEDQALAIIREWHLDGFDEELIQSFRHAWLKVSSYLSEVLIFLNGEPLPEEAPECFKDTKYYRYKKYYDIPQDTQTYW